MADDELIVEGEVDIRFNAVGVLFERQAERGQRIFGRIGGGTAMSVDNRHKIVPFTDFFSIIPLYIAKNNGILGSFQRISSYNCHIARVYCIL